MAAFNEKLDIIASYLIFLTVLWRTKEEKSTRKTKVPILGSKHISRDRNFEQGIQRLLLSKVDISIPDFEKKEILCYPIRT